MPIKQSDETVRWSDLPALPRQKLVVLIGQLARRMMPHPGATEAGHDPPQDLTVSTAAQQDP
jgi:hypothetical protein